MGWRFGLNGDELDLVILRDMFRTDPKVDRDSNGFYLSASALDSVGSSLHAFNEAKTLLRHMNGTQG